MYNTQKQPLKLLSTARRLACVKGTKQKKGFKAPLRYLRMYREVNRNSSTLLRQLARLYNWYFVTRFLYNRIACILW